MDQGTVNIISNLVGSVGLPGALCFYVMWSNNKTLKSLQETIAQNTIAIQTLLAVTRGNNQ